MHHTRDETPASSKGRWANLSAWQGAAFPVLPTQIFIKGAQERNHAWPTFETLAEETSRPIKKFWQYITQEMKRQLRRRDAGPPCCRLPGPSDSDLHVGGLKNVTTHGSPLRNWPKKRPVRYKFWQCITQEMKRQLRRRDAGPTCRRGKELPSQSKTLVHAGRKQCVRASSRNSGCQPQSICSSVHSKNRLRQSVRMKHRDYVAPGQGNLHGSIHSDGVAKCPLISRSVTCHVRTEWTCVSLFFVRRCVADKASASVEWTYLLEDNKHLPSERLSELRGFRMYVGHRHNPSFHIPLMCTTTRKATTQRQRSL